MDHLAARHRCRRGGPTGCHDASIRGVVYPRIRASTAPRISAVLAVRRPDRRRHDPHRARTFTISDAVERGELPRKRPRGKAAHRPRERYLYAICTLGHALDGDTCGRAGCRCTLQMHPGWVSEGGGRPGRTVRSTADGRPRAAKKAAAGARPGRAGRGAGSGARVGAAAWSGWVREADGVNRPVGREGAGTARARAWCHGTVLCPYRKTVLNCPSIGNPLIGGFSLVRPAARGATGSPSRRGQGQTVARAASTGTQADEAADFSTASRTSWTWRASAKDGAGSSPAATAAIRSRTSWVNECS
ncbi:hypothetical protein CLV70_11449 [Pseudosporangium ferrugineum]|uniref:Uncharacterized protein n=1 Tax=Pseudosporangium ferrugineum TaxID=439699 RepID=A0A2T0RS20_9ACTN|nr:hypothetical protein CLV70_11449 [Pseudosporangium ferrugineum]